MGWFTNIISESGGLITGGILAPLNFLSGMLFYLVSIWEFIATLVLTLVVMAGGLYVIVFALVMVFSIDNNPFTMFKNIFNNLITMHILLLQGAIEVTKMGLAVIAIIVNGVVNLIPFT